MIKNGTVKCCCCLGLIVEPQARINLICHIFNLFYVYIPESHPLAIAQGPVSPLVFRSSHPPIFQFVTLSSLRLLFVLFCRPFGFDQGTIPSNSLFLIFVRRWCILFICNPIYNTLTTIGLDLKKLVTFIQPISGLHICCLP